MTAIRGSGDLQESLVLPTFLIVPGMGIAGVGGVVGAIARRLVRAV